MSTKNVIEVQNVTKVFNLISSPTPTLKQRFVGLLNKNSRLHREKFTAVDNVSFSVKEGESIALLGHNGSGKSTLLQLIAGVMPPTKGSVITNGRISPLISVGAGFHPDLSGYENIFLNASLLGLSNKETRAKLDEIIAFSELENFIHAPVKTYSSGMYARLGFAVAISADPQILIADEILSVGDQAFSTKCKNAIRKLQDNGLTLLLVTHAPAQAKDFCERYIRLDKGKIVEEGRFSSLKTEDF